ncbi:unnamed protein product [Rotaria sp. Silwood2]|nr:unnamed protein product [Rotaria sp. Silwood2]CAF3460022.1 unnamed protein product [Rotaria sp. Silwood2]CAF4528602.1 unnamed protein product [Rotaria sp. Silwood2]CAF4618359.1 unnamed protein product [Rotaria sp. Silwood2]
MVLFKSVLFTKDKKPIILKNLNLDSLKRIMHQNEHNTVILDCANSRFLFYDYKTPGSKKYNLYDVNVLDKSDEIFDKVLLLKYDDNDIQNKIDLAENFRRNCVLSIVKEQNAQQQQSSSIEKDALDDSNTATINSMDLFIIDEEQPQTHKINYNKTILESDDNDSNRPTFDDIIKLDDESLFVVDELEDDEINDNNMHQQQILFDINDKNENNESTNNNKTNISINNNMLESNNSCFLSSSEKFIIDKIMDLSNRFSSFEKNVNRRLSNMENNINLIYERQSLQSLLSLLNSVYLITSDRLETRRFDANESYFMLKFFNFISKQLMIHYTDRWSTYADISKKISLKPKSIEINLLGFGIMDKSPIKKLRLIQSPASLSVRNTNNCRLSYVSQCRKNYDKPPTHVLVFEGTTSSVYFNTELFKEINSSSSSTSSDKKIISMKMLLRKLLQLERIVFFLSFYYKIELSQFFSGLICFHFYHNSHIDSNLTLKNIMSSEFSQAIPLLFRLYLLDQFILTY